jgi:hypothetical protein
MRFFILFEGQESGFGCFFPFGAVNWHRRCELADRGVANSFPVAVAYKYLIITPKW